MISLSAGQPLYGFSSTTNISYTIEGKEGTVNKVFAHGFFYQGKVLFTPTNDVEVGIFLSNNNQPDSTEVKIYVGGSNPTQQIFQCTLEADWSVSYDGDWKVYDQNGLLRIAGNPQITVSDTAPSNPSMGDLWVEL